LFGFKEEGLDISEFFRTILDEEYMDFSLFACEDFIPLLGLRDVFSVIFRTILEGIDFSILS
jgi:hypothetical protein